MNPLIHRFREIDGLYALRGWAGYLHALIAGDEVVLIDTGLWQEQRLVDHLLQELGFSVKNLRAILLTHGHLDHAGNLAHWAKAGRIEIYAHLEEQPHINGAYPYQGSAKVCGWLERVGRGLFGYRPAAITHPIQDGQILPFWGGLQVMHLPGHTAGHCGFYSEKHQLLFSGDLFASYFLTVHIPPFFLNSQPERLPASLQRVWELNPPRILPNHYEFHNPQLHARRFRKTFSGNAEIRAGRD